MAQKIKSTQDAVDGELMLFGYSAADHWLLETQAGGGS
jgi:hypothetical protein